MFQLMLTVKKMRRTLITLISVCIFTQYAYAFDISDPFSTNDYISTTSGKSLLPDGRFPCQVDPKISEPLTLLNAIENSLCRNPQTRSAWAQVKLQAANMGVNQAAYLPTLDIRSSLNNTDRNSQFSADSRFDSNPNSWDVDTNISFNWVLYDFGLREANLTSARFLLNAASANQDDMLRTNFFNTAQAFYEAQAARSLLNANIEAEKAAEQSFTAAEVKFEIGVGALVDKLQAQTSYAQAKAKRIQSEGDLKSAGGNLAIQMGIKPDSHLQLTGISEEGVKDPQFHQAVESLIKHAVKYHPKVLYAQGQLQAANAKIDASRAEGLPKINFTASDQFFNTSETPINNLISSRQSVETQQFGVQVTVPLFEGFGRTYKVRASEAQAESKAADLANTENQVSLEVWKSYQGLHTETENIEASKVLSASAEKFYDAALERYKAGVGTILELMKAQSEWTNANQQRLLALTRWQTAKVKLAISLGELDTSTIN